MSERSFTAPFKDADDQLLASRLADCVKAAYYSGRVKYLGFLDEREVYLCRSYMEREQQVRALFWGGYPSAARLMVGISPAELEIRTEEFPFVPITFLFRREDRLSHRDFLGALMALGIQREVLGDILVEEGRCVSFVKEEMCDFLLSQCRKIGRVGVKVQKGAQLPYPSGNERQEIRITVASARLDSVAASLMKESRAKAVQSIQSELVSLNYRQEVSNSAEVRQGDILSIRGYGKFEIEQVGPMTKKGRLVLIAQKYV